MSVEVALLCIALSVVGATVQASIGLGYGLLASPWLALIDHDFIPGAILLAVLPLSFTVAVEARRDIDQLALGWALVGRLPGVVAASAVVAAVSSRALAITLAVAVLAAVAISRWAPHFEPTRSALVTAGVLSGFMGTTTGVGGPPMAIVFQRSHPPTVRATLAAFFGVGTVMSLVGLAIGGDLTTRSARLAALLLPGVVVGLLVSRRVRHHLLGDRFRMTLLAVSAGSAIVLLIDNLT